MKNTSKNHHRGAKLTTDFMLEKWKKGEWLNNFVSKKITSRKSSAAFPSVDREFEDEETKAVIACEFKPDTENKRGILTGLGQSIAYLKESDASYLISPKYIEDFNMEKFLKEVFERFIFGKLPVGLVIFDRDYTYIRLVIDISKNLKCNNKSLKPSSALPWAVWRDNPPIGIFRLLESACINKDKDSRWAHFFDNYYAPAITRKDFKLIPNNLYLFKPEEKQIPFKAHKERIKKYFENKLTKSQIKKEKSYQTDKNKDYFFNGFSENLNLDNYITLLARHCWEKNIQENIFQNYKKNYTNFVKHSNLTDNQLNPTALGKKFVHRCLIITKNAKNKNEESNQINDEIAQIYLVVGKIDDLIDDICKSQKEIKNKKEFLKKIITEFDKRGVIPRNANRSTSGNRQFLQAEIQFMNNLSLTIKSKGVDKMLYNFNFKRIDYLINQFYLNYGDVYKA